MYLTYFYRTFKILYMLGKLFNIYKNTCKPARYT